MPINADFPMLSYDQANPMLKALQSGREQMRNSLYFPKELLAKELANKQNEIMNQIYGIQSKYAEPMSQQELLKSQLYNKYYGPNIQSEIASRGAQAGLANEEAQKIRMLRQNPLLMGENTKDLAALQMSGLSSPDQVQQIIKGIVEKPITDIEYKKGLTQSMLSNLQTKPFTTLPADAKAAMLGQLKSFGYNDTEALHAIMSGKDMGDLAQAKGYSREGEDWPSLQMAPTPAIRTQQERANIAQAGIRAIEPSITEALAPYAKKWNGTSLSQLKDSLKGENDDKIGRAIGAAAVAQELAMLRIRAGGAPVGIGVLKESLDASKSRLNVPDLTMTPKQFDIAQKYISDQIGRLNQAENMALYPQNQNRNNFGKSYEKDLSHLSDDELKRIAGER